MIMMYNDLATEEFAVLGLHFVFPRVEVRKSAIKAAKQGSARRRRPTHTPTILMRRSPMGYGNMKKFLFHSCFDIEVEGGGITVPTCLKHCF